MVRRVIALVMIIVALCLLNFALFLTPAGPRVRAWIDPAPTPKPTPVLTVTGTPPSINARSAYLLDATTNHVLLDKNGAQHLPMASTTKIMTAVVVLNSGNLNRVVTVQKDAVEEVKKNFGSSAQLVVGDQISLKDLLYGLLLPSGDDAAIAIADTLGGSQANFVRIMNADAQRLHLRNTHYINADGLTYKTAVGKPDPNHYTTAADLAQLTRYALQNPLFAQIVQTQRYVLPASAVHHAYIWTTTDDLLSEYPGAVGVKTGYTVEAGYCLVFAATDSKNHLVGVILNEKDINQRFTDAATMLNWGFNLPMRVPPSPTPTS
jgi:D-alanyl-D-alanine carboxypeptidase (penicillin-binding protein 5/6)